MVYNFTKYLTKSVSAVPGQIIFRRSLHPIDLRFTWSLGDPCRLTYQRFLSEIGLGHKKKSFMNIFCSQRTKSFPRYHLCSLISAAHKTQLHPGSHFITSSKATFRKRCLSGLSATTLTLCKVLSFPTPLFRRSIQFITDIFYRLYTEKSRVSGNSLLKIKVCQTK